MNAPSGKQNYAGYLNNRRLAVVFYFLKVAEDQSQIDMVQASCGSGYQAE
jgi:hypothetical protein